MYNQKKNKNNFNRALSAVLIATNIFAVTGCISAITKLNKEIKSGKSYSYFENISKINELVDYSYNDINKEDVIKAIERNPYIDDIYKEYAKIVLEYMTNKYPKIDLRIFYENMLALDIEIVDSFEDKIAVGTFTSSDDTIRLLKGYEYNSKTIIHELLHSFYSYFGIDKETGAYFIRYDDNNSIYNEALIESLACSIVNSINKYQVDTFDSYSLYQSELNYLLSLTDFDYYSVLKYGTSTLIDIVKEKYPDVDIDFISKNTYDLYEKSKTENISNDELRILLNENFKLCLYSIKDSKNDLYEPFINFCKIIDLQYNKELYEEYFNRYNSYLIKNGMDTINIDELDKRISYEKMAIRKFNEELNNIDKINSEYLYEEFYKVLDDIHVSIDAKLTGRLLDIYNDYLFCHGYTSDEVVNSKTFNKFMLDYNNIKGFIGVKNDKVYPFISNNSRAYTILNEDGSISDIDINNVMYFYNNVNWIDIFMKYSNKEKLEYTDLNEIMNNLVPKVLYNDVPILINGNLIGNYNINDLAVNYYLDSNNNIKYKVTTLYGDILYSEDNLDYSCSWLPFRSFIKYNCFNTNSVELSNLLNDNYIKDYILNHGSVYDEYNMLYDSFIYNKANDKLSYFPRYTLKVIDNNNQEHKFDFNNIKLINYCDDKIFALELSSELKNTSLIKVFEYYNLIIDNVYEYSYSDSEIHEIVNNYINEFHKGISSRR